MGDSAERSHRQILGIVYLDSRKVQVARKSEVWKEEIDRRGENHFFVEIFFLSLSILLQSSALLLLLLLLVTA